MKSIAFSLGDSFAWLTVVDILNYIKKEHQKWWHWYLAKIGIIRITGTSKSNKIMIFYFIYFPGDNWWQHQCFLVCFWCNRAAKTFFLYEACSQNVCTWMGEGLYTGCLPDDITSIRFQHFEGIMDLRCTAVKVVYLEDTPLTCTDKFYLSQTAITLYMNNAICVSIPPPPYLYI